MRIAYLLSGQPRFVKRGFESFRSHLFSQLRDTDILEVFIHTWDYRDRIGQQWCTWRARGIIEENHIQDLTSLYQPISLEIEPQLENHDNLEPEMFRNKNQFYSLRKSIEAKVKYEHEQGFKYDLVIKGRTDVEFLANVDCRSFDLNGFNCQMVLDDTMLYDMAYGCNSSNIDLLTGLYESPWRNRTCPENIIHTLLKANNIPLIKDKFTLAIIRD